MEANERAVYRLHRSSDEHRRRRRMALDVIARHPDYSVSTSWGKDSVVLMELAAEALGEFTAVHARYQSPHERLEDMDAVRDAMLARECMRGVRYIEVSVPGEWQVFERVGHAFRAAETREEERAIRWWDREFARTITEASLAAGCCGSILGYRCQESDARRLNVAVRGVDYVKRDGYGSALPLAHWTGDDVWSEILSRGLPWLRIYDGLQERDRARSDFTWTVPGIARYEYERLWRRLYPRQIAAWLARWPELRQ